MNTRKRRQAQELAEFLEGLAWVCIAYPRRKEQELFLAA